jgi:hypothetical protein
MNRLKSTNTNLNPSQSADLASPLTTSRLINPALILVLIRPDQTDKMLKQLLKLGGMLGLIVGHSTLENRKKASGALKGSLRSKSQNPGGEIGLR